MLMRFPLRSAAVLLLACRCAEAAPPVWQDWPLPLSVEAQPLPVQQPKGWQVKTDATPCRLLTLTVFDGPPQEQASLVPETDQTLPAGRAC